MFCLHLFQATGRRCWDKEKKMQSPSPIKPASETRVAAFRITAKRPASRSHSGPGATP